MKNQKLAICLKTYPDEDDMQKYCDGSLDKPEQVKVYQKGRKYFINPEYYDKEYYKIIDKQ